MRSKSRPNFSLEFNVAPNYVKSKKYVHSEYEKVFLVLVTSFSAAADALT